MEMKQRTIIEEYMDHIYKAVLILLAISCAAAGIIYAGLKIIGAADFVHWSTWIIYMAICLIYVAVCTVVIKKPWELKSKIKYTKIIMFCILLIQANILYLFFPGKTMWGVFIYFFIIAGLLVDFKFQMLSTISCFVFMIAQCMIHSEMALPERQCFHCKCSNFGGSSVARRFWHVSACIFY